MPVSVGQPDHASATLSVSSSPNYSMTTYRRAVCPISRRTFPRARDASVTPRAPRAAPQSTVRQALECHLTVTNESTQPVQTVHVSFCAGLDDVGGSAATHDAAVADLQVYGDLSHRFGAFGYGSNVIAQEVCMGGGGVCHRL